MLVLALVGLLLLTWLLLGVWLKVGVALAGYRGTADAATSFIDWIRSLLGQ